MIADPANKTCPRCKGPNTGPEGARLGPTISVSVHHSKLWKASGGPGLLTSTARLCTSCGGVALDWLIENGFIPPPAPPEPRERSLYRQEYLGIWTDRVDEP